MEKKTDLRVMKTQNALTKAFVELMNEKQFEEITVNELCDRAMVRRATFYKHFADKYEFFQFAVNNIYEQFVEKQRTEIGDETRLEFYLNLIVDLLKFVNLNEPLVKRLLESNMFSFLSDSISRQVVQNVKETILRTHPEVEKMAASPEVTATFFSGAILHSIRYWIMNSNQISEEQLINDLEALLRGFHVSTFSY